MEMSDDWTMEVARDIGERLLAEAVERGEGVTWYAHEHIHGSRPRRVEHRLQGGSLYRGSAGISLFLTELGRLAGRADLLELAGRAFRHAL